MTRILHASDLHFGRHGVPAQVDALERIIAGGGFDLVVLSGDLSQRTRTREFTAARAFLDRARRYAPVFVVPGNHDTAWWMAPLGLGSVRAMHSRYRRYISEELEPSLALPGLSVVGLNSSHGIQPYTLTTRPRDLSVVGALRPSQWRRATVAFGAAPPGALKVLVFHHNVLRGRLSNRWGLASRAAGVDAAARTGADLVLCGHDHEDRIEQVNAAGRRFVVSNANTLSTRVRGGGPSSLNVIEATSAELCVAPWVWSDGDGTFVAAEARCFTR